MDDKEWEERTEAINGRLWVAEANIENLEACVLKLQAENVELRTAIEEVENVPNAIYELKKELSQLRWCVENGVRG